LIAHTYPKNSGPSKNPHKGWNSGWWNQFEEASVGFQYIAWKDFEPINNQFDFAKIEEIINRPGSAGTHFVLRLYCDWAPSDANSDCPAWLYSQVGVKRLKGDGGTSITDYNDPNYLSEAVQAIQALANHYDGDPRVHAFQLGVLGYWGEWHTSGFKMNGVSYTISDTAKNTILNTYKTSFTKAKIQGRYPWLEPLTSTGGIGFHNDYFVPNNGHSDSFDTTLSAGGQWLNGPVGGEAPPRDNAVIPAETQALLATSKGDSMIATGHYSTMAPGAYRATAGSTYYDGYMKLHRMMGYNYQIESVNFADTLSRSATMSIQLMAKNIGVAPIYYDWQVQFALLNSQDDPVMLAPISFRLATVKPGESFTLATNLFPANVSPGNYRLAVRMIQPGADVAKTGPWKLDARNAYILFANDLPTLAGSWRTDNALKGEWSVLGGISLR
jgi:hypothetical protein